MNRALIITLDNCLIKTKSGDKYPKDIYDWQFDSNVIPRLSMYAKNGYIICVVSNQAAIERGIILQEDFEKKMDAIKDELDILIDEPTNYIFCPSIDNYGRKPNPGMAYQLALKLELDLVNSIMVGNSKVDQDFAYRAGIGEFLMVKSFIEQNVEFK